MKTILSICILLFVCGVTFWIVSSQVGNDPTVSAVTEVAEERPTAYFFNQRSFPRTRLDLNAYRAACERVEQARLLLLNNSTARAGFSAAYRMCVVRVWPNTPLPWPSWP